MDVQLQNAFGVCLPYTGQYRQERIPYAPEKDICIRGTFLQLLVCHLVTLG